jgi:ketosteroid isomerase-like protein
MSDVEARLRRLEAINEIKELTARYCWHVARHEGAEIVDLFTDDGVLVLEGLDPVTGREALARFYDTAVTKGEEQLPFIQNHIIEVDGDHATGTCGLEARFSRSGKSVTVAGYYEDSYRRDGERWLFAERKVYFHHAVPLATGWAETKVEQ